MQPQSLVRTTRLQTRGTDIHASILRRQKNVAENILDMRPPRADAPARRLAARLVLV
jgi:hypothetical protein